MKNLILLSVMLILVGSSFAPVPATVVPEPTKIEVIMPAWVFPFLDKINPEIDAICKKLKIQRPVIELEFNPSPIMVHKDSGVVVGYILGYYTYDTKVITVFLWGGQWGSYYEELSLYRTIVHELHHAEDHQKGLPQSPSDHNALFDKWMKDNGLWWPSWWPEQMRK